ncbi:MULTISPECIES: TauD/TfdA family dioxygenase [Streptomyces]|uniref:TauD/TfdA family dioxygenase n=1 Tax=Streptomyces lycii TaxID=2654337 RepID=A0ABQ7FQ68_9ACTN|nr:MULTISPECIES: TauD/TfdA family dioxygenase [Streptomyces]KAF4409759.1 TauD/TfdA family dioxygenase [Streptomyces lycii]PGH47507.1 taurine dioxygenase [Streptomyces sp. Ru87]
MTDTVLAPTRLEAVPLTGTLGAEIRGVDAGRPLDDGTAAELRAAVLRHKVVFLRDQQLTYESQVAFSERFGELTSGHPIFASAEREPLRREMDSHKGMRANHWHTDLTFVDRPPAFAVLYGVVIPPVGGDTMWADAAAAYASLPDELRDLADRLRIVHSSDSDYTSIYEREAATNEAVAAVHRGMVSQVFQAEHPAVRVHPETGERSLLLGGFATRVAGLPRQASRDLLRVLQEHVTRPEHTVRWKWRSGDLAIWDNQATQHYAVFDYGDARRVCQRTTVAGPVPVGIDGRPGVALTGDASAYYTGATSRNAD